MLVCLMWQSQVFRYGGLYLDLDTIVQKSMEAIGEESFACAQSQFLTFDSFANGIMKMSGQDGHKFADKCLE